MSRKLPYLLIVAGVLAIAGISFGSKADKDKAKDEKKDKIERNEPPQKYKFVTKPELMAAKLKGSQDLLEHIALDDFPKIESTAEDLVGIAKTIAFLNSYKGKEYDFHISTFRRAAETMAVKAKERNMDGVMVSFNDLTLSCLKCHRGIRDKKFEARLPVGDDRVRVAAE